MRIKLFTFRYSASLGGFDDTPLTQFVRDKEVLAFREHFFTVNEVPHLACVVTWQEAVVREENLQLARELREPPAIDPSRAPIRPPEEKHRRRSRRSGAPDPAEGLDERERALFNTLREWRARKATEEGVPPYLIFTNKHFVEMVTGTRALNPIPDAPASPAGSGASAPRGAATPLGGAVGSRSGALASIASRTCVQAWCPRGESNPHSLSGNMDLNHARLPIPPPGPVRRGRIRTPGAVVNGRGAVYSPPSR